MAKRSYFKRNGDMSVKLLTNKWVLYLLTIIGLVQLLAYGYNNQWCSTVFFVLVGLLAYNFSKNLIVVLLVAVIGSFFFCQINTRFEMFREGFKEGKDKDDGEEAKEEDEEENFTGGKRVDKSETARRNYENMRKMVGSGGITQMSKETTGLMKQQTQMIENMEKLRPMAKEAATLLEKLEGSKLINTMAKNKENFNRAKNNLGALKIN